MKDVSRNAEISDFSLTPCTGTFRHPGIEAEFQRHRLARTQRQLRITLCFGAFFELAFWLTDLAALGYNATTQLLLLARLLVALSVAVGLYLVARNPHSTALPRYAATAAEIVAFSTFMLVIAHRPAEIHWHGMSMSIMLLVVYLFIPNAVLNATAVALAATLAFVLLALEIGTMNASDMVTLILSLIFTNAFGSLAAYRHERLSRQEFQAQAVVRGALATQRQFVSMLSHEFRTPLAIIDTTAQRLGSKLELKQPEWAARLAKIRRATTRLLSLLDNCLTEDRLVASDLVLHAAPVDLRESLLQSYGDKGAQSSPRIRLILPETPLWAHCDRHLLDIALSNLVGNALKYSPEESTVTVRLQADALPGKIAVRVEDRGPGVAPADRERIFDKFFRSAADQRVPGAGLGLHLARDLARRHGGDVTLEPEDARPGAVFTLSLPLTAPASA